MDQMLESDLQYFIILMLKPVYGIFQNTTNLTNLVLGGNFVTNKVTNLSDIFNDSVSTLDLSDWDTSNVTNMKALSKH